jgi:hypothetical protein
MTTILLRNAFLKHYERFQCYTCIDLLHNSTPRCFLPAFVTFTPCSVTPFDRDKCKAN